MVMQEFMNQIKEDNNMNTWSQLSWTKKMKMIDSWTIIIIISNWFHIVGIGLLLFPKDQSDAFKSNIEFFMGMGTFLIWLSLLKYFQYSQDFYILPATMLGAGSIIFASLVSAIPIIVGVSFFCMTEFSFLSRFATLD